MTMRKGSTVLPVRFTRIDAGLYSIWDNGGKVNERGRPYRNTGEISGWGHSNGSGNKSWTVKTRDGTILGTKIPTLQAAKDLYMDWRVGKDVTAPPKRDVSGPPVGWLTVVVRLESWYTMDDWRSSVFRQMTDSGHSCMAVQRMLDPVAVDHVRHTCTVYLPSIIARDLARWYRPAIISASAK